MRSTGVRLTPGRRLIQAGAAERVLRVSGKILVHRGLIIVRLGMASERRRERLVRAAWLTAQFAPEIHG